MPGEAMKFVPEPISSSRIDTSVSIFRMNFRQDCESVCFGMGDSSVLIFELHRLRDLEKIGREVPPNRTMPCKGADFFKGNFVVTGTADGVIHVACGRRRPWCKNRCGSCFSVTCLMFMAMVFVIGVFSSFMFVGGGQWVPGWHPQHVGPRFAQAETAIVAMDIGGMFESLKRHPISDVFTGMDQRREESMPQESRQKTPPPAPVPPPLDSVPDPIPDTIFDPREPINEEIEIQKKEVVPEIEEATFDTPAEIFDVAGELDNYIHSKPVLLVTRDWNQNCFDIISLFSDPAVGYTKLALEDENRQPVPGVEEKF